MTRYKGRIYAWDVVNEAIDDDSSIYLRQTDWFKIGGEEYIAKAFQWAHEADPNAQLFYNDYNTESPSKRDKIYQLVLFPTKASALVNELYLAAAKNDLYAKQGRSSTNDLANQTRLLFRKDTSLMGFYNREFAGGKWKHFMDQSHLGYMNWADPPANSLRALKLMDLNVPDAPSMGISVEGSEAVWPGEQGNPVLPEFDIYSKQSHYIDIFNKGKGTFTYIIASGDPWITFKETNGAFGFDARIWVTVNWNLAPKGKSKSTVRISGTGKEVTVSINTFNPVDITPESLKGFVEGSGYVSMEAEHFTRKSDVGSRHSHQP